MPPSKTPPSTGPQPSREPDAAQGGPRLRLEAMLETRLSAGAGARAAPSPDRRRQLVEDYRRRVLAHHRGAGTGALEVRPAALAPAGARRKLRFAEPARPGTQSWVPLGPSAVLLGQMATRSAVSGRVTGVAVSSDGQRVYAGAANGGVFRSDDGGHTFYPLMNAFDLQPTTYQSDSLSMGALAIDPDRPDRVYAGSGEGAISDAYFGVGPVVSYDGGLSWRKEPWDPPDPAQGAWFFQLAVDPEDPEHVVAATAQGLCRRRPRNEGVAGLPPQKPQSYLLRYDASAGAPFIDYWSSDGETTWTAWPGGAKSWPGGLTILSFVLGGAPHLLTYLPAGSWWPWRQGSFRVYRVEPDGALNKRLDGEWETGLLLMVFELGGAPHLVRYERSTGKTSLSAFVTERATGALRLDPVWRDHAWPRHLTQLAPLVLGGVPHFLSYKERGVIFSDGPTMLQRWTGTGDNVPVWPEPKDLGHGMTLLPFEVGGEVYFQRYRARTGAARVARFAPDGSFTWVGEETELPRELAFVAFPIAVRLEGQASDQVRALGYNPSTGVAHAYRFEDGGGRTPLWTAQWPRDLRLVPFEMGFEWAWVRDADYGGHPPPDPHASAVVVACGGGQKQFYAAFYGGHVYTSADGTRWTASGHVGPGDGDRTSLAVQSTNPAVLYAQRQDGKIYRGDVDLTAAPPTVTWSAAATGTPQAAQAPPAPAEPYVGTQGDYDLAAAVAPDDVNRLYLGGSTAWATVTLAGQPSSQWSGSVFRSDVTPGAPPALASTYLGASCHADIHTLVFTPGRANALWVGSDGGVFFAPAPTTPGDPMVTTPATERLFESRNAGLQTMTANAIGLHPTEDAIAFSSNQDNGCERFVGDEAWSLPTEVVIGDSGRVLVKPDDPQQVLATYIYGWIYSSTDGGDRYAFRSQVPGTNPDMPDFDTPTNFYAPMVSAGAALPDRVAFGARRPFISDDFGATWASIPAHNATDDLPANINALAFSHKGRRIFAGLMNGEVYRFEQGLSWTRQKIADNPWTTPVTSIAVDPGNDKAFFVAYGGDLSAEADGWQRVFYHDGAGWEVRSGPMPHLPGAPGALLDIQHNALVARTAGGAVELYVGADLGVWRSRDAGRYWEPFGVGLPESAVLDLQLFDGAPPRPLLLRAALHGRGAYELVLERGEPRDLLPVQLYLRKTILDRGLYPVQDGAADPTRPAQTVNHRDGRDVKIALPLTPNTDSFAQPASLSFVRFAELPDQSAAPELRVQRRLRVYLQLHNRGASPGDGVTVMVLLSRRYADLPPVIPPDDLGALAAPPPLPADYARHVRAGTFLRGPEWSTRAILACDDVRAGLPEVLAIDLPGDAFPASGQYCLLAIASSAADPFTSTETDVDQLVIDDPKAVMKILFVRP